MPDDLDPVWKALSDPTRREILDVLREGPRITGDIVKLFPDLSRVGVVKHLEVLREAQLVLVRKDGRKRFNRLNPVPIQRIYQRWVKGFERHWAGVLADLPGKGPE